MPNDYLESRKTLFVNSDLHIGLAAPHDSTRDYFFKNADADEMIFVHKGHGWVETMYGQIPFEYGDYIVIPRGTIYKIHFLSTAEPAAVHRVVQPIEVPSRYRNQYGQMLEHAPFCERDFKLPKDLETHDEHGDFLVKIKKQGMIYPYVYATHPFDAVGWDGNHYPGPCPFSTLSRSPAASTCRRPSTSSSRRRVLWCAPSCRVCTTTTRRRSPLLPPQQH
jgi:homogentisate 1,2-dioxygenase